MPELPEVETTRRGLLESVRNQRITDVTVRRYDLRQPIPKNLAKTLTGLRILDIRRRAKYLLIDLESNLILLAHLGMSGGFTVVKGRGYVPKTHDHVLIQLENGQWVVFNDPRRFGVIDLLKSDDEATHVLLKHLGPEPLSDDFSTAYLRTQLLRRNGPIKPVLMDQKLVVGVGNIYASESLYLCGVHPLLPASKAAAKTPAIIDAIRATLQAAIDSGGSTLRNYVGTSGKMGYFQHRFNVYGRDGEVCFRCDEKIQTCIQTGRATYWCAHCQRLPKKWLES